MMPSSGDIRFDCALLLAIHDERFILILRHRNLVYGEARLFASEHTLSLFCPWNERWHTA
jgi:hypothetical protein